MFFIIVTVLGIIISVAFYSQIKGPVNGNKYVEVHKGDIETIQVK